MPIHAHKLSVRTCTCTHAHAHAHTHTHARTHTRTHTHIHTHTHLTSCYLPCRRPAASAFGNWPGDRAAARLYRATTRSHHHRTITLASGFRKPQPATASYRTGQQVARGGIRTCCSVRYCCYCSSHITSRALNQQTELGQGHPSPGSRVDPTSCCSNPGVWRWAWARGHEHEARAAGA